MENNAAEAYIKAKVKEYLSNVQAFFQRIQNDQGAIQLFHKSVKEAKDSLGEDGFEQSKEKIMKIQELHYSTFMLDSNLKLMQGLLFEFKVMADILGVELEIPEDAKEFFDNIISTSPHLFRVENGEAVMADSPIIEIARKAFTEKMGTEEALKGIYDSI